jgi:hypothetical protein
VLPGEYKVQVTIDGQAQTKTVAVRPDPLVQITDADRQTLYRTLVRVTDLQRAAGSAADATNKLDERMKQIAETLKPHPNVPAAVKTSVDALTKQVTELRTAVVGSGQGGGGGGGGEGGGAQPVRNRINQLKGELIGSQSPPTRVQMTSADTLEKRLTELVGQVNTVITTTLPGVYKQLHEAGIYPGVGAPIQLVRQTTTEQ